MSLQLGDIIQANETFHGNFTLPEGLIIRDILINTGNIYTVSGFDSNNQIIFLIEENGPGAEILFSEESKFTKL
jgi:hypothetical protein